MEPYIDKLITEVILKLKDKEYDTFNLSIKMDKENQNEEEMRRTGIIGRRPLKSKINFYIKEKIEKEISKKWALEGDVTLIFDLKKNKSEIKINPVYLLCKYNKYSREISQTRWDKYSDSVEGFILEACKELYNCTNIFLHGAGREDVNVHMLGEGRLCTIEIVEPQKRKIDFETLERKIEEISEKQIKLNVIKEVGKEFIWIGKEGKFEKEYRAVVEFEKNISNEIIKKIEEIKHIKQRTPTRVEHRRADLIRERDIYKIKKVSKEKNLVTFDIMTQAGAYIKELISGDEGRTQPNFSLIAGCNAKCIQLDVSKVHEKVSDWW
jgi:tRNA pseudouridine synthase 10